MSAPAEALAEAGHWGPQLRQWVQLSAWPATDRPAVAQLLGCLPLPPHDAARWELWATGGLAVDAVLGLLHWHAFGQARWQGQPPLMVVAAARTQAAWMPLQEPAWLHSQVRSPAMACKAAVEVMLQVNDHSRVSASVQYCLQACCTDGDLQAIHVAPCQGTCPAGAHCWIQPPGPADPAVPGACGLQPWRRLHVQCPARNHPELSDVCQALQYRATLPAVVHNSNAGDVMDSLAANVPALVSCCSGRRHR